MIILYIENIFVLNSLLDVEFLRLVANKDKSEPKRIVKYAGIYAYFMFCQVRQT